MAFLPDADLPAPRRYADRTEAGARLARALAALQGQRPLVLAIPRGGVPVAQVVAQRLGGDLDVVLVRKIGVPGAPEFALGAVDESGRMLLLRPGTGASAGEDWMEQARQRELATIRRRRGLYGAPAFDPAGRVVVVVDDGLATGATMLLALQSVRRAHPARLLAAAPVGSAEAVALAGRHADAVVCPWVPPDFQAVGQFYRDFDQVDDAQVARLLAARPGTTTPPQPGTRQEHLP